MHPTPLANPKPAPRLLFGEIPAMLLASQRVAAAATESAGFQFQHPQLPEALADLLTRTDPPA